MLTSYPVIDPVDLKRQGQAWWTCDKAGCGKEAEVKDATIPKGWVTSDPDDNPLRGAAQFCAAHASFVTVAPVVSDVTSG